MHAATKTYCTHLRVKCNTMQELEVTPEGCAGISVENSRIKNQKLHIFPIGETI